MPTSDPVGTALFSVGAGASTGAAMMTAGVLLIRLLQAGNPDLAPEQAGPIIGTSVFCGILAAVTIGWLSTRAIADYWRRAVTAGISVFGAAILAMFATAADMIGGRVGIAIYLVLLIAAAITAFRAAARAAQR